MIKIIVSQTGRVFEVPSTTDYGFGPISKTPLGIAADAMWEMEKAGEPSYYSIEFYWGDPPKRFIYNEDNLNFELASEIMAG